MMLLTSQRVLAFHGTTTSDAVADLHLRLLHEDDDARIIHFSTYPVGDHIEGSAVVEMTPSLDSITRELDHRE